MPSDEQVDVLVVGAGLSGIGAAVHLRKCCPQRGFVILEGRERPGPTCDLFRYPAIRSDSAMYTLGYSFKPWEQPKAIADGPSILKHVQDTAREHDIEPHPLRAAGTARRLVQRRGLLGGRGRTQQRRRRAPALLLPLHVQRLLPLRRRLHAALRGHATFRRHASRIRSSGARTSRPPAGACRSSAAARPR